METLQLTIPAQEGDSARVKIRPREVRAWLDNLPLLDLPRTTRLVHKQLRLMNRQTVPAALRLTVLGDFLNTYQRLEDTRSVDPALKSQLKYLCQDIGFGYKIATTDLANKPGSFLEGRHLPLALLGSIHILGLQLLDCYANYQRAPRAVWGECLALYTYAWRNEKEGLSAELTGIGKQQIDSSFRLIALLRLADPYRLPPGMAGALRTYFLQRIELCSVHSEIPEGKRYFELKETFGQAGGDQDPPLYLELDALLARMQRDTASLEKYREPHRIGMAREIPAAALLRSLQQTMTCWRNDQHRGSGREDAQARIELVYGLEAVYCVVNQGRHFDASLFLEAGDQAPIDLGAAPAPEPTRSQSLPTPLECTGINRSNGGLALRYHGQQSAPPQVGQLVALRRCGGRAAAGWVVAACRWLVHNEDQGGFDMGLQYLAREPRAVVVRRSEPVGCESEGGFQAGIAATQKRGEQRIHTLILRTTKLPIGSRLTLYDQGHQQQIHCSEQLEAGASFVRFVTQPV